MTVFFYAESEGIWLSELVYADSEIINTKQMNQANGGINFD